MSCIRQTAGLHTTEVNKMRPHDAYDMSIESCDAALEAIIKITACTPEMAGVGLWRYFHGEQTFHNAVYHACSNMAAIEQRYAAIQAELSALQTSPIVAKVTLPAPQRSAVASAASPPCLKPPRATMHPIPTLLRRSKRVKTKSMASVPINSNCYKERHQAAVKSNAQYLGMMRYLGLSM